MPGTAGNLFHEPVWVAFGDTLLGLAAEGDITITFNEEWVDQMAAQTGNNVLESYHKGGSPTCEVTIAEIANWDNWAVAFPKGQKQVDTDTTPNNRFADGSLTSNTPFVGGKASAIASNLVLIPQSLYAGSASTETVRDFVFPKAWCRNVGDIPFGIDSPNILTLTFGTLFNPAATEGDYTWFRGLATAVAGSWAAA